MSVHVKTGWVIVAAAAAAMLGACSGQRAQTPMDSVNPLAHDRDVFQQLLSDHRSIRRTVTHRSENGVEYVEAVTESDDPVVAARIKEHAGAMQKRMKAGAQVRVWDPVFRELFRSHGEATLEVTQTEQGVRIIESSADPATIALLRAHAMGVSDFVRSGHEAGSQETPRFPADAGSTLPPPEVALGGLPHRFLLAQPDAAQVALLKSLGVGGVMNFRKPSEHAEYDEQAAAAGAGLSYCNIPYKAASELTDEALDRARERYVAAEREGLVLAVHCRTGNRVGPGLAAYLALDKGEPVERAILAARAVGTRDAEYERITLDYIRRHSEGSANTDPR